ncbi:MAG: glycosyltransferase [Candidatus Nanoarchaeia archaeon]
MKSMSNLSLFEISWEVCNVVGGIHTVLSSKIDHAKEYATNYFTIGPYKNEEEFKRQELPEQFQLIYNELKEMGITIHYGLWETQQTNAQCILVELSGFEHESNEIKRKLWEMYQIDSLNSSWFDFGEVITWSWACGVVCEKFSNSLDTQHTIIHTHEWMSAGAVFYINSLKINNTQNNDQVHNIKTVFTTHATMLGRAYYGTFNKLLVDEIGDRNPHDIARELNVHTKYESEYAALKYADISSCVSILLKEEISKLYGIDEVEVSENGFNYEMSFDECIKDFNSTHTHITQSIQDYFKPYYHVKKNMRVGIISGRYEVRSKGYDVTFKALGELNNELKQSDNEKNIVILAPIIAGDFEEIEDFDKNIPEGIHIAPLTKHNIEADHELMQLCTNNGLLNRAEDRVKIILIPRMISKLHRVFGYEYYDILRACDYSLFPSGYEPWGYTPHESIAYGVVTLTSKFAGFGAYWLHQHINNSVVSVVKGDEFEQRVVEVKNFVKEEYNKRASTQYREKKYALEYSRQIHWRELYQNYAEMYEKIIKQ